MRKYGAYLPLFRTAPASASSDSDGGVLARGALGGKGSSRRFKRRRGAKGWRSGVEGTSVLPPSKTRDLEEEIGAGGTLALRAMSLTADGFEGTEREVNCGSNPC